MRGVSGACGLGLIVGVGVGCWHSASGHCGNLDGDFTCAERGGGQYCDACQADGDGCSDVMPAEGCHFAGMSGGGTSTGGIESTSSGEPPPTTSPLTADTGSTSSSTSTDDTASSTDPAMCQGNEDCVDAATPFCGPRGECVSCNGLDDPDGACMTLDPALPYCMDGACVQCTEHGEQCAGAGCNLFTNACLPADAVVHVGSGQPFATLQDAAESFEARGEGTIIVHSGSYEESFIAPGQVLAFLADVDAHVEWRHTNGAGDPQLEVRDGSTVLIDRLVFLYGPGGGSVLEVMGAAGRLWVDRTEIASDNHGIVASESAELVLRNCLVKPAMASNGLRVESGASATVLYSTLVSNLDPEAPAVSCDMPGPVEIRNSIIVGPSIDDLECPGASLISSATEAVVGPFDESWFETFDSADPIDIDLRLTAAGAAAFVDRAQWLNGDPRTDIDGGLRPSVDGSPDYPGGHIPQP